jgi:hypothetical protein
MIVHKYDNNFSFTNQDEDTRALPPGAQYTKWHEASAARGDYASGRAVRPMEPCCQGALKGAFGG